MKVVVGSKNPVKIEAVARAFQQYWPDCEVAGITVVSGVSEQPMSEEETIKGAKARACAVLQQEVEADFGVGLEGGVTKLISNDKLFECAWVAIIDRKGSEGIGGGLYFELPPKVAKRIKEGGELGPVMDEFTGTQNVKQNSGAIGIFTKGKLDRTSAYVQLVLSAMIKFVSPEWFE